MSTASNNQTGLRFDLALIASWIAPGTRVLDLGCGEGHLLAHLEQNKGVVGTGIEISEAKVVKCVEKGLSVLHGDIIAETQHYPRHHFDYVIVSQTLQQVFNPTQLLESLLRTGKRGIVSFPNFSHWRIRAQMLLRGNAPKTKELPYEWYNTPNIRVLSIDDFIRYSRKIPFTIHQRATVSASPGDQHPKYVTFWPNLRATYGIFMIGAT